MKCLALPEKRLLPCVFMLCLLAGLASPAVSADRVVLRGGGELLGEVLKANDEVVIVDLGPKVLRLDRKEVLRVDEQAEADPADANRPVKETEGEGWQLYRSAELKATNIEKNVERFGEAVVMVSTPRGQGSGFLINPDGHLITNYHVIANETRIKVTVFDKTEKGFRQTAYKRVRIVAINPYVDLALLKILPPEKDAPAEEDKTGVGHFVYAYLAEMKDLEAGQPCFAIGNPLGLTRTVSQGIISTKNRNFEGRLYIQTTTDINPGNSGGPLFNYKGEVIGVTSMGYMYFGGLNFAIPVDVVKRFIANRDAFAYDEDNPNAGFRYLQPAGRESPAEPPEAKLPDLEAKK